MQKESALLTPPSNSPNAAFNSPSIHPRELSIKQSIAPSQAPPNMTYEHLLQIFQNYQPNSNTLEMTDLHQSPNLKLKKYKQSVYYGQIVEGRRNGRGLMMYHSGQIYEGSWRNDQREGYGWQKFANLCVYEGQYLVGKFCGKGKYVWPNGQFYEGQWVNNVKNGTGIWCSQNRDTYVGSWSDGKAHEFGVFTQANGNRYQGMFNMFVKQGQGVQKYINGDIYRGNFSNGRYNGEGEFYWADGSYYHGTFKDGLRCGKGVWKKAHGNSDKYEGDFHNNKKQGKGIYHWKSGHMYKGTYKNNKRTNYGQMFWSDGSFYKGQWQNDLQHGQGQFFNVEEGDKGIRKGMYKNGELVVVQQEEDDSQYTEKDKIYSRDARSNQISSFTEDQENLSGFYGGGDNIHKIGSGRKVNFKVYRSIEEQAKPVYLVRNKKSPNPLIPKPYQQKMVSITKNTNKTYDSLNISKNLRDKVEKARQANKKPKQKLLHSAFQIHKMHRTNTRYNSTKNSDKNNGEETQLRDTITKFQFNNQRNRRFLSSMSKF